jgi:hypothetical protein
MFIGTLLLSPSWAFGKFAMGPQPVGRAANARPWASGPEIGVASVAAARLDDVKWMNRRGRSIKT